MFGDTPQIDSLLDAINELATVRDVLEGMGTLALALAQGDMHDPRAITLLSSLCDYCSRTTDVACDFLTKEAKAQRGRGE